MWIGVQKQSAFGLRAQGKNYFLLFDAFCFWENKPLLDSLPQRCPIFPLSFSSLGHNVQSHDLQLTALIQKCSNKKTVYKPMKKLCASPTLQIYMCFTSWAKGNSCVATWKMVLCFREHFKCFFERQGFSRFCWRISLQHHPRAWVLLLCISFEDDLGITVCWLRETSREKRASGLMAHGKMDRSKQKRESWDVTYGLHTLSIREGPKQCLCQGNGCMLSPASSPWESEMSDFSICNQSQMQQHCCKQVLPVGGDIFDPEAGFMCPLTPQWVPLLLPNHLQGSKSACVMLPPACSEHQGTAGSGTHMVWQPLGKGQPWALQVGLCPAGRAGWHYSGCCGVGKRGLHHSPPKHPPV